MLRSKQLHLRRVQRCLDELEVGLERRPHALDVVLQRCQRRRLPPGRAVAANGGARATASPHAARRPLAVQLRRVLVAGAVEQRGLVVAVGAPSPIPAPFCVAVELFLLVQRR